MASRAVIPNSDGRTHGASAVYQPLDFMVARFPCLPVETYLDLGVGPNLIEMARRPGIRRALAVASPSLVGALDRKPAGETGRQPRLEGALLRYMIRMSTRPTPFGLFAGVALAQWGRATDLALSDQAPLIRARPDMEWLLALVLHLERDPTILGHLRLVRNPMALMRGGRLFLPDEGGPGLRSSSGGAVSIRATGVVTAALDMAREPILHNTLVSRLCAACASATVEKVERMIRELCGQAFLWTDLRPPLTAADPISWVVDKLAGIPAAAAAQRQLVEIAKAARIWEGLPKADAVATHQAIVEMLEMPGVPKPASALQVDAGIALGGTRVASSVGGEVARAAELLLRLSPLPRGPRHLAAYRQAFESKYGPDREVPLLELLDPSFGLGPLSRYLNKAPQPPLVEPARMRLRQDTLVQLATQANHDHRQVVELDPELIAKLELAPFSPELAPHTLELYVLVAATSPAAIDRGDFQVVIGPNVGVGSAGRSLGRFAHLLGTAGEETLVDAARLEESFTPGDVHAEVVYMPAQPRSANVMIHPPIRRYEVAVGVSPGVDWNQTIPLSELTVGVRGGRLVLRWPARDVEVRASAGHMLNHTRAPEACRFLLEVSRDRVAQLSGFDWGPASNFPFLPRIQSGRIIVRPAQWRIDSAMAAALRSGTGFSDRLEAWRPAWGVPRRIWLASGDNRLLLDLTVLDHVTELRREVEGLRQGGSVLLQEAVPQIEQTWCVGPGGHYVTEFVVPLALRRQPAAGPAAPISPASISRLPTSSDRAARLRPPGSDWLFLKLYCPVVYEDDVLSGPLQRVAEDAVAGGVAESWFYIRYSDPDPHLRIRFRGDPARLKGELLPRLCDLGAELVDGERAERMTFDTYDREVERFGGPEGVGVSERVFAADSRAAVAILGLWRAGGLDLAEAELAVLSIDSLLAGLGLTPEQRLHWCQERVNSRRSSGAEYRVRQHRLRDLLGRTGALRDLTGGESLGEILAKRGQELASLESQLRHLATQGLLSQPLPALFARYVHLSFNRLSRAGYAAEGRGLGLLLRTRHSLDRAPISE